MVRGKGFTIVELLIVIVVIAILAAISIVAYNGIQDRAKTTKTVAYAKNIIQALKVWRIDIDALPPNVECIYPADKLPSGATTCTSVDGAGQMPYNAALVAQLESYMGGKVEAMLLGGTPVGSVRYTNWFSTGWKVLTYSIPVGQECKLSPLLAPDGTWLNGARIIERGISETKGTRDFCVIGVFRR